jgi:hypothetical protein
VGIRCADQVTLSTRKSRHYFADSGGRSVGIVRLRTKATEFIIIIIIIIIIIVIVTVQPFVGSWPLFQFLDPIHSR